MKVSRTRKSKVLKVALSIVVTVCLLLVGLDFLSYKLGGRSHLFGTINTYSQKQTLHLFNVDVKVNSAVFTPYQKPVLSAHIQYCKTINTGQDTYLIGDKPGQYFLPNPKFNVQCAIDANNYDIALSNFNNGNQTLDVKFSYKNASNHPINMKNYKFSLAANTAISNKSACSLFSGEYLPGPTFNSCLRVDISKTYHGPISLLVTSGGTQKEINLSPKF